MVIPGSSRVVSSMSGTLASSRTITSRMSPGALFSPIPLPSGPWGAAGLTLVVKPCCSRSRRARQWRFPSPVLGDATLISPSVTARAAPLPKEAVPEATSSGDAACWLCGRTSGEINSALSGDTEDEVKIGKEIAATKAARDALVANSTKWRDGVPEAFKEFDLAFVLQNADQFRSMQFLGALIEEAKRTVRELDEVSFSVRKGAAIKVGGAAVDESQRASIAERLNDFEKRTGRRLKREQDLHDVEYQRLGYIARLSGLKLLDGIEYLKEAGILYYDLQLEAKERARVAASKLRPTWRLRSVKFKDFPREVSICTVCERLLREVAQGSESGQPLKASVRA